MILVDLSPRDRTDNKHICGGNKWKVGFDMR